jgi:hypothetical protein
MNVQVAGVVAVLGLGFGCGSSSPSAKPGPEMSSSSGAGGQRGAIGPDAGSTDARPTDAGGGVGGAGGASFGNPGFGGFPGDETPSCSVLETQYANTVAGAQICDITGSSQCQQVVSATLSTCPTCMTYVNDAAPVTAIQLDWMDQGCASQPAQNCSPLTCPQLAGGRCVASSSGGTCSPN